MSNGDLPAFVKSNINDCNFYGLTKREYFAAMAMQGVLACTDLVSMDRPPIAVIAVEHADALIKALGKSND